VRPVPRAAETQATDRSDAPEAPWSVSYADGAGNDFRFEQSSAKDDARYTYSPVTPERSSSGRYSGGTPAAGALDREQVAELWRRVRGLEAQTALHTDSRDKGTGSFRLVTPARERAFIVQMGAELASFDEFVAPFRSSTS
jgi:hypothetical protein